MDRKIKLITLITKTKKALQEIDVSAKTKMNYHYEGFNQILRHCEHKNVLYYDKQIIYDFVLKSRELYESNSIYRARFTCIRKAASMLDEYYCHRSLKWNCLPSWHHKPLNDYFGNLLEKFCQFLHERCQFEENTIQCYRSNAYLLLRHTESNLGYSNLYSLSLQDVTSFLLMTAKRRPRSMGHLFDGLRKLGLFLIENKLANIDIRLALTMTPAKHRKLKSSFTNQEADRILSATDRQTTLGKRDYAMLLLADKLGIRCGDICNLRFENMNWKQQEISFTQGKTNIPYSSPVDAEVMNAIADYILHARPDVDLPYIFIREVKPYGKLQRGSLGTRLLKYMNDASVPHISGTGRCLHAFRRKFGVSLLNAEIPASEISNALGHASQNSLWHYIAADIEHLRLCSLDLSDVHVTMEALQ